MNKQHYSVDHLELFEFHDSTFELDRVEGNDLAVYVRRLNISKDAEQNPKGYDLEIKRAHITFHGISNCTYDPGRTWKTDENGNSVPVGPEIIYRGKEAVDYILKVLREGITVFSHTIVDESFYQIEGMGIEPFFEIRFMAQSVTVEWDEYQSPAWYELTKQFKRKLLLNTPDGEMITEAHFITRYDSDALFNVEDASDVDPKEISTGIKYEDKEYWGRGKDCSGQDAFADLQKKLPDGVFLKCCLSCRHGNQSPFSNAFDRLYCMKDAVITEKMDLCRYTTDAAETNKRNRHFTDVCENWAEQSDEYYVYSDYPLYLKSEKQ